MEISIKTVFGKSTINLEVDSSKTIDLKIDEGSNHHGKVMLKKTVEGKMTINLEVDSSETIDLKIGEVMQIFVRTSGGKIIALEVGSFDTIENVKTKIHDKEGIPVGLSKNSVDGKKTINLEVDSSETINLEIGESPTGPKLRRGEVIQIFLMTWLTRNIIILEVDRFDTIGNVKAKIQDQEGILVHNQILDFSGKQLDEGLTLADYNIQKYSIIEFRVRVGPQL